MPFDDTTLTSTHEITRLTIQSNTQIAPKATNVISKLSPSDDPTTTDANTKPPLVILRAQSRWASKLISIVEIAKRNLESTTDANNSAVKIFQYSSLSSEIIEIERKPRAKEGLGTAAPEGEGESEASEDEGAFQTMGAASGGLAEGGLKKRAVPVLTVYLASRPVKALKSEFGYVLFFSSAFPFLVPYSPCARVFANGQY